MTLLSTRKVPFTPVTLPQRHPSAPLKALDMATDSGPPPTAMELFNQLVARMNSDLQQRMSKRAGAAQAQGEASKQEGVPKGWEFEFEVTVKEQRWRFHKPTFAMRTQMWSFDWPTLRGKEASFDVPDGIEWRNERRYLGDFYQCKGKLPNITCGWWPVYADVPVAVVKTKRVIFTVPEVTSERKEFKWDVPEFYTEEVTWYVKVPEFKLIRAAAKYAEDSQKKAEKIANDTNAGIQQDVEDIRATYKDDLYRIAGDVASETRENMTKEYNVNLGLFNGAIDGMQAQINALPEDQRGKYQQDLQQWITNRQSFIDQYVQFMQNLDAEIQGMVKAVLESLGQPVPDAA